MYTFYVKPTQEFIVSIIGSLKGLIVISPDLIVEIKRNNNNVIKSVST